MLSLNMFIREINTYRKILFVFTIHFLFSLQGNSQSFAIKHFNTEEGLAGNTIYDIFQDSLGYMWFGTDYGLCSFDGVKFKNYNSPLLSNSDVLAIKAMLGKIYFQTLDKQLYYIQNDSIKKADPEIFTPPISDFIDDKKNKIIWYYSNNHLFSYNYKYNKKTKIPYKAEHSFSKSINKTDDGIVWILTEKGLCKVNEKTGLLEASISPQKLTIPDLPNARILADRKILIYGKNNAPCVFDGNDFKEVPFAFSREEKILSMDFIDQEWWIGTNLNIYTLNSNNEITNINSLLNNVLVNKIFSDKNKNIWLGTQNNGIYLINNLKIRNYTTINSKLPANQIQEMTIGKNNSLWMGIEKGWISHLAENQFSNYKQEKFSDKYYDLDYFNEELYISANKIYKHSKNKIREIHSFTTAKTLCVDNENLWVGTASQISRINFHQNKIETFDEEYRSYAIERLNENIWLGSLMGLFKIDRSPSLRYQDLKKDLEPSFLKNPNLGVFQYFDKETNHDPDGILVSDKPIYSRYYDVNGDSINYDIRRIAFTADSSIWMSTSNAGLHYIQNDTIHHFNMNDGLVSNSCNDLFIDDDDNIWIATTKGLSKIEYPSLAYTNYTTDDGILSNWITSITRAPDSTLYIGTNRGLSVVHQAHIRNSLSPIPIRLRQVKINEKDTSLIKQFDLIYNKNNIAIDFIGISFSSEVSYRYCLNNKWKTIQDHRIGLTELAPGNYDIEVEAHASNGATSEDPLKLSIKINPPWWKTTWFIILFSIFSISLIYWGVSQIKKREREKMELNKQFAELELQALQAQMNPHFVFNAMGAIQNFILKKDENEANRYLTSFSKLMRLFLDSSREKYISLKDEITLLELYLKIEKLRLGDKLNYTINWAPNLQLLAIDIPSMLIQPFVENAINHGLIFKESDGLLIIDFQMKDPSVLCCTITDNGIGRAEAKKRKNRSMKSYKSRATSIVEDRLRTLNFIEGVEITFDIEDRLDEFKNVQGTIVKIIIPLLD